MGNRRHRCSLWSRVRNRTWRTCFICSSPMESCTIFGTAMQQSSWQRNYRLMNWISIEERHREQRKRASARQRLWKMPMATSVCACRRPLTRPEVRKSVRSWCHKTRKRWTRSRDIFASWSGCRNLMLRPDDMQYWSIMAPKHRHLCCMMLIKLRNCTGRKTVMIFSAVSLPNIMTHRFSLKVEQLRCTSSRNKMGAG